MLPENAASVHEPTDIALCGLNTRSMLMKRSGRPRSAVSSAAESGAAGRGDPARVARERAVGAASTSATVPMIAARPAAPPTKK